MIRDVAVETALTLSPFVLALVLLWIGQMVRRHTCRCGQPATVLTHRHTGQRVWRCAHCQLVVDTYIQKEASHATHHLR